MPLRRPPWEPFDTSFPDNQRRAIRQALQRIEREPKAPTPPMAVGVSDDTIYAYDLQNGAVRWQQGVSEPKSRAHIAGDAVVLQEQHGVVVRDLRDGAVRAIVPDLGLPLVGADGDGSLVGDLPVDRRERERPIAADRDAGDLDRVAARGPPRPRHPRRDR